MTQAHRRRSRGRLSRRSRRILFWTRWTAGATAMLLVWAYTFWVGLDMKTAIFLPAGVLAGICIACALSVPIITLFVLVVAALSVADSGLPAIIRRCGEAFAVVGGFAGAWHVLIWMLGRRKIRRDEAGYL